MGIEQMTGGPRRNLGALWWAGRRSYFLIFLREISSVFIAAYVVLLIILIAKAGGDQALYESYFEMFTSPGMLVLHVVAFLFSLLHSITFFNLIPKGMSVRLGEEPVPPALISGPIYAAWGVVSVIVLLAILL